MTYPYSILMVKITILKVHIWSQNPPCWLLMSIESPSPCVMADRWRVNALTSAPAFPPPASIASPPALRPVGPSTNRRTARPRPSCGPAGVSLGSAWGDTCVYIYIWVNYNISLAWIKAIWGWFPILTIIPGLGRSEVVIIYPDIYIYIYIYHHGDSMGFYGTFWWAFMGCFMGFHEI